MKTDMNEISKQVVWICMVFEFLTERGQPAANSVLGAANDRGNAEPLRRDLDSSGWWGK